MELFIYGISSFQFLAGLMLILPCCLFLGLGYLIESCCRPKPSFLMLLLKAQNNLIVSVLHDIDFDINIQE